MLFKKRRGETTQDISVFLLLPVTERLVSDRQTVEVEKMFQMNFICVVTDLTYHYYLIGLSIYRQVDFKKSIRNKTTSVNSIMAANSHGQSKYKNNSLVV